MLLGSVRVKAACKHVSEIGLKYLPEVRGWPLRGRSRNRLEWPGQRQQPRWPKPRHKPRFLSWPQPIKHLFTKFCYITIGGVSPGYVMLGKVRLGYYIMVQGKM